MIKCCVGIVIKYQFKLSNQVNNMKINYLNLNPISTVLIQILDLDP